MGIDAVKLDKRGLVHPPNLQYNFCIRFLLIIEIHKLHIRVQYIKAHRAPPDQYPSYTRATQSRLNQAKRTRLHHSKPKPQLIYLLSTVK